MNPLNYLILYLYIAASLPPTAMIIESSGINLVEETGPDIGLSW